MTASPFDHPFLRGLLGDAEISMILSPQADIAAMVRFEVALAKAEAAENVISDVAASAIDAGLSGFEPEVAGLRAGVARDGVVIPELIKQLRTAVGQEHGPSVHLGATSQDAIDTSFALRSVEILDVLGTRIAALINVLHRLEERQGATPVMGHTRMQAAIPVTAARKIGSWRRPLERHLDRLSDVRAAIGVLHFAGAAGTLEKLGDKGQAVRARLAELLSLREIDHPRHSERDGQMALASWLSLVTGSLGKMGQDIALMAQSEMGEVKLASGGGSSAMPHKQNPVAAEVLVTLARFNATLVSGVNGAMIHENERSGAAWTLEWMLLPQMLVATGAALLRASEVLDGLAFVARGDAS